MIVNHQKEGFLRAIPHCENASLIQSKRPHWMKVRRWVERRADKEEEPGDVKRKNQ
ncbi:MAG: hypothetical protein QG666_125 [Euryarchaeota archaeon]|nr:hypothetical protein [Euryarchaeota archaeon]